MAVLTVKGLTHNSIMVYLNLNITRYMKTDICALWSDSVLVFIPLTFAATLYFGPHLGKIFRSCILTCTDYQYPCKDTIVDFIL